MTKATTHDLFHPNGKLRIGINYVVDLGLKQSHQTTREQIKPKKAWTKRGGEWVQYNTNGETSEEYDNYKLFLKAYIRDGYIFINKTKA